MVVVQFHIFYNVSQTEVYDSPRGATQFLEAVTKLNKQINEKQIIIVLKIINDSHDHREREWNG